MPKFIAIIYILYNLHIKNRNLFYSKFIFLYVLRSNSIDKARVNSRDRQNNQQNRENDNYNNNQKNNNSSRRYDHKRHRNIIQRSRESSKDRSYRGGNRNFDDLHRHRYVYARDVQKVISVLKLQQYKCILKSFLHL